MSLNRTSNCRRTTWTIGAASPKWRFEFAGSGGIPATTGRTEFERRVGCCEPKTGDTKRGTMSMVSAARATAKKPRQAGMTASRPTPLFLPHCCCRPSGHAKSYPHHSRLAAQATPSIFTCRRCYRRELRTSFHCKLAFGISGTLANARFATCCGQFDRSR